MNNTEKQRFVDRIDRIDLLLMELASDLYVHRQQRSRDDLAVAVDRLRVARLRITDQVVS
jgi:hypothetical protein